MTVNFDSILQGIENANFDLMGRVRDMCDEAEEIQTNFDELLECLGTTDHNSALDAIRELKAASVKQVVVGPVFSEPAIKFSDSTALTPAELASILTQSISKAVEIATIRAGAIANVRGTKAGPRTFRDSACLNE
jgi:predicted nuclease with TOPRIM domain